MYTKVNLSYIVVPLFERGVGRDVGEIFKGWLGFGIKKLQDLVGNFISDPFESHRFLSLLKPWVEGVGCSVQICQTHNISDILDGLVYIDYTVLTIRIHYLLLILNMCPFINRHFPSDFPNRPPRFRPFIRRQRKETGLLLLPDATVPFSSEDVAKKKTKNPIFQHQFETGRFCKE